jgi:hypothetical protein
MAFSDFKKISDVQEQYNITYTETPFINVERFNPTEQFIQELEFNRQYIDIFTSEAARCETIIFPVLREIYQHYVEHYALWIQRGIFYDALLNGTPDYFVATRSQLGKTVVGKPLVIVVEAKKSDFEQGWGQCLSELYAIQQMNEIIDLTVYGMVTDAKLWEFGKLQGSLFVKNRHNLALDDLGQLLGALSFVFQSACGQLA